jgi:hypothetical protein
MVNVENINRLIQWLEKDDIKFDMGKFEFGEEVWELSEKRDKSKPVEEMNFCGTAACIAGHAMALFRPEIWKMRMLQLHLDRFFPGVDLDAERNGMEILGIDKKTAGALFYPWASRAWQLIEREYPDISEREQAVILLKKLRDEGAIELGDRNVYEDDDIF